MENNKPQVRFKGFDEDWHEKKLEYLADFSKGKGYSKNDLTEKGIPIILYGRLYTNYKTIIKNVETFVKAKGINILSKGGEVVVPASGETQEDIVRASVVEKENVIIGGDLNIIIPNNELNSIFLALTISNGKVYNELVKRAQGKSVVHIRNNDLKEALIPYSNKTEQKKISNFFENIDKLLIEHQQKQNKLKALKKAMLSKMFPQQGQTFPEIRFKGFTGDWDKTIISELADVSTGYAFDSKLFNRDGEYLVITNGNIQNELAFVDSSYGNRIDIDTSLEHYVLNIGDILVTMDGTVGRTAKTSKTKQILAQRVGRLKAHTEPEFLYQLLNTGNFFKEMTLLSTGGTIKHISLSNISNYKVLIPTDEDEKKMIGNYFKNIDNLIINLELQIIKFQNIKKAFLAKMFI